MSAGKTNICLTTDSKRNLSEEERKSSAEVAVTDFAKLSALDVIPAAGLACRTFYWSRESIMFFKRGATEDESGEGVGGGGGGGVFWGVWGGGIFVFFLFFFFFVFFLLLGFCLVFGLLLSWVGLLEFLGGWGGDFFFVVGCGRVGGWGGMIVYAACLLVGAFIFSSFGGASSFFCFVCVFYSSVCLVFFYGWVVFFYM